MNANPSPDARSLQPEAREAFIRQLNAWGRERIPFLFCIDFELQRPFACRLGDAAAENIFYDIRGVTNLPAERAATEIHLERFPIPFSEYEKKFKFVEDRLHYGDSFLANLTLQTEITLNVSLPELVNAVTAKYRLLFKDQFVVFSPETFVRIAGGKIYTNPMKGTIDAAIENAAQKLRDDKKELAEHVTVVDLLRNDLSQVATEITVSRFRYLEKVNTSAKSLWQMSSEITGTLPAAFENTIGDLLFKLLPAGSITGAPKPQTIKIIREAEMQDRGFYTGVFGYFNGSELDSGVMIRFVEKDGDRLFYRSGGGITTQSNAASEYQEAIDKIYVPVN